MAWRQIGAVFSILVCVCGALHDISTGTSYLGFLDHWFHTRVTYEATPTLFWIGVATWLGMAVLFLMDFVMGFLRED